MFSNVTLPPPPGCNQRAIWMGYQGWTQNGEAFALRLDKPLEAGKTYSYAFTYASDGTGDLDDFSPIFYTTNEDYPINRSSINKAFRIGRLLPTDGWRTDTLRFTAAPQQQGHFWLIIHAKESSGMILGACDFNYLPADFLAGPLTLCFGDQLSISAPLGKYYSYIWSTGDFTQSISVGIAGTYSVTIRQQDCLAVDSIVVVGIDCEVRLVMPNYFSPNNDSYNTVFVPMEHNYIERGIVRVYNRWGTEIFKGDLFTGWDGSGAPVGVYYYRVDLTGKDGKPYTRQGPITLAR